MPSLDTLANSAGIALAFAIIGVIAFIRGDVVPGYIYKALQQRNVDLIGLNKDINETFQRGLVIQDRLIAAVESAMALLRSNGK